MGVKTFMIEKTGASWKYLRRYMPYSLSIDNKITCPVTGYIGHDEKVFIGKGVRDPTETTDGTFDDNSLDKTDPRFPKTCKCGYEFLPTDEWQLFEASEYARVDDPAQMFTLRDAAPGAMYYNDWLLEVFPEYAGPDGRSLTVRLPNGSDWNIDSVATNCDMKCKTCGVPYAQHQGDHGHPYEEAVKHKCWIRHGTPPVITVGKDGITCTAGAGSIAWGVEGEPKYYHGFLQNGEFT